MGAGQGKQVQANRPPLRHDVRQVACPRCHVLPAMNCVGTGGRVRVANHLERSLRYAAQAGLS